MVSSFVTYNRSVQSPEIMFGKYINMYEYVITKCRAAYYHLKNIHCLKALLTQEALVTVVHLFVSSRINRLFGLPVI